MAGNLQIISHFVIYKGQITSSDKSGRVLGQVSNLFRDLKHQVYNGHAGSH